MARKILDKLLDHTLKPCDISVDKRVQYDRSSRKKILQHWILLQWVFVIVFYCNEYLLWKKIEFESNTIWAKFQPRLTFPAGCSLQPRVGWDFVALIVAPPPPLSGGLIFIIIIISIIIIYHHHHQHHRCIKPGETMMGNQCATPVAFTINFTGSTGLLDDDDFDDDRTGSRIVWRSLMNCMIVQFMMFTDYNSGHWRCVRTVSRRERESPKVKKGADPRRKSKLKVCCHFF